MRRRSARWGWAIVGLLGLCALLADVIAPAAPSAQHRAHPWHPPEIGAVRVWHPEAGLRSPFVFDEDGEALSIWGRPADQRPVYLLGSDGFGRDLLSRILHGARISLGVGVIGGLLSVGLGWIIGTLAGFFGGAVDFILMRLVEVLMAVPGLYLVLALRQVFPLEMPSGAIYLMVILALSAVGWAGHARVVRSMTLSLRSALFVTAARATGVSRRRIITAHLMPNTAHYVGVTLALQIPAFILGEIALSFLGVGVSPPDPSWGNLLKEAHNILHLVDHPWVLIPAAPLLLAVLGFNWVAEGLRARGGAH